MKSPHYNWIRNNIKQGFTLIEMMVVIAIFGIFTSIIVLDYNKFGEREKFVNFVYDIALDIRQTQVNGIAVRGADQGIDAFERAYGIHFDYSQSASSYSLFIDFNDPDNINGNKEMDVGESTRQVNIISKDPKYKISQICGLKGTVRTCSSTSGKIDIVFLRPNPDATITFQGDKDYTGAEVVLTYTRNSEVLTRKLIIDATGQISIQS